MRVPIALVLVVFSACRGQFTGPDGGTGDGGPGDGGHCVGYSPLRNLYFGDLHVHTAWSYDAYAFGGNRATPDDAYAFARGGPVTLPSGQQLTLRRPLDFAAVTDHSEWLGETWLCTDTASNLYNSTLCQNYRALSDTLRYVNDAGMLDRYPGFCDGGECRTAERDVWQRTREAANRAYDRSTQCAFTAFHGYEYSGVITAAFSNQHRCVIFRNDVVPQSPINAIDTPTPQGLWQELRTQCLAAGTGCDALAIPHNMNRGRGLRFLWSAGQTVDEANDLARIEPIAEIYQHKGASECKPGLGTTDPLCAFEQVDPPLCPNPDGGACFPECTGDGGACNAQNDFLRNVLKDGLLVDAQLGANPFRLGFVASTDTHNSSPGATDEDRYVGHGGTSDMDADTRVRFVSINGSGGLAAVWATENTRDALFDAMQRRETYATSGPRITVRFFGGWDLPTDLCQRSDWVDVSDQSGVPMGGTLPSPAGAVGAPKFVVSALMDPGVTGAPGTPLQRVQIIKGWISGGQKFEQVFEVAGDANNGASVDTQTCVRSGPGATSLCAVWTDPGFNASQHAVYYARVVENPSCRWSGHDCRALRDAGTPLAVCDDGSVPLVTQERAWTSPIWYRP